MQFGHFCLPTYYEDVYQPVPEHMRYLVDFMASSEDLGFDAVWANEHHFHAYGGHVPSPPIFLSAIAQRTKRVRLGTSIIVLPLHNPIEIAEQMAMVDAMSGGRLELGVGRGFVAWDHHTFGINMEEGQPRTVEGLEVILKAWTGKPFTHHGQFYNYENLTVWPRPQQEPVPVWIACSGTPSSFERTAREGHKLLTVAYLKPLEKLGELTSLYRTTWIDSGRPAADCTVCTHYQVVVDEDGNKARKLAEEALMRYQLLNAAAREQAVSFNEAWAGAHNEDINVPELVAQGRLCAGTPDECVEILERAMDVLGVTIVDCNFLFGGLTYQQAEHSIDLFASQ
ncbi:MAG: LLM class flavin-dependent oxidoreductase, partial [Chloroflexi bacterium]|nr:LLM class flavin-dependent oxidoreductase [Chloroflexota bacterium]